VVTAFAAIYVLWGSTYLAIRVGLESVPPFLLAATRFLMAGAVLYVGARIAGVPKPTDREWWAAAATGLLMLVGGVGGVTWAEQYVASGPAALLVATVSMWMVVLDPKPQGHPTGRWRTAVGLAAGLAGVAWLVRPGRGELGSVDTTGAVVILASAAAWAYGSLRSRTAALPRSPVMTVAIQMLAAGVVLAALSRVAGEWPPFDPAGVTVRSAIAVGYLALFGSIVTLCSYVWLLRRVSAAAVGTYAFVNPLVAVVLGAIVLDEPLAPRVVGAAALIVTGVVLLQSRGWVSRPGRVVSAAPADRCCAGTGRECPVGAVSD
jgi:drug/metabolite transporter (DMT)-like permease